MRKELVIHQTNNYEMFSFAYFNRDVNKANLNKLIKLNKEKNRLPQFPIIVDPNNVIVDGQHRFMTSKALGLPVYYVRTTTPASVEEVYSVNVAGKKHRFSDKFDMLLKSRREDVVETQRVFESLHGTYNREVTLRALTDLDVRGSDYLRKLDTGTFFPNNTAEIRALDEFVSGFVMSAKNQKNLMTALIRVIGQNKNRTDTFKVISILKKRWHRMKPELPAAAQRQVIVDVYNHGKVEKSRIKCR